MSKNVLEGTEGEEDLGNRLSSMFLEEVRRIESDKHLLQVPRHSRDFRTKKTDRSHYFPVLFFQVLGKISFPKLKEPFCVAPGQYAVLPSTTPLQDDGARPGNYHNVLIKPGVGTISIHSKRLKSGSEDPEWTGVFHYHTTQSFRLNHLLQDILNISQTRSEVLHAHVRSCLSLFFSSLYRLSETKASSSSTQHPKVSLCRGLVAQEISNPKLSLSLLAKELSMNADYLSSLFQKETGMGLLQYVQSERVAFAKHLLTQSTLSISEIAQVAGYRDPAYFARVFKKIAGVTPKSYR